jgi:hypothetical protein
VADFGAVHAEEVLYTYLTDVDALEFLARERFSSAAVQEIIPSDTGRKIVMWALEYFFDSGRKLAPTAEAIKESWGQQMEQAEIVLGDGSETDSIQWVIDQLRAHYAYKESQRFVKQFATAVAKADPDEKAAAVSAGAVDLYRIARSLVTQRHQATLAEGVEAAVERYEDFQGTHELRGLAFGMPLIDLHYGGVRDGEIAVFSASSGAGKSWVGLKTLYEEWRRERQSVFFSLELSLETCFDRLACIGAGVSYARWQLSTARPEEMERVHVILDRLRESPVQPLVIAPPRGERSMTALIRQAQSHDARSVIIDQLTFVSDDGGKKGYRPKWESTGDKMHELHELISDTGGERLSALVLHQLKREGIERAQKSGRYEMTDLADGSEVERTASFVAAVFQSTVARSLGQAEWQTLKARRVPVKDWTMVWELEFGHMKPLREVVIVD